MAINVTGLLQNPLGQIMSPYTNTPIGNGAYLMLFVFIIGAVFIKTKSVYSTLAFMLVIGMLFTSGGIFMGMYQISMIFIVISVIAVVGLVMNIIFMKLG